VDEADEISLVVDEMNETSLLEDVAWVIDADVLAGTLLTGSVDETPLLTPAAWLPFVSTLLL
jgi:hypothetical protein